MEVQPQQEMQEPMVQLEKLQQVKLVPLVEMQVDLMLMLEEHLRLALEGHLEVAVEGHLEVAVEGRILQGEVEVGCHLVATLALTAAALPPWMQPLLPILASQFWCPHLSHSCSSDIWQTMIFYSLSPPSNNGNPWSKFDYTLKTR